MYYTKGPALYYGGEVHMLVKNCSPRQGYLARVKQHVHSFLGDKGLGIQQGTSVWVGSPKSGYLRRSMV